MWLFVASAVIGYIIFYFQPQLMQTITDYFKNLVGNNEQNNQALVLIIYQQNVTTSLMALFGGIAFGLLPLGTVIVNGLIIGFVIHYLLHVLPAALSTKLFIIVVTLLPHGVFELPIVLITAALGLKWGLAWLLPAAKGQRKTVWKQSARQALLFIPLLVVVLAIAAVVEVFVSGKLASVLAASLRK